MPRCRACGSSIRYVPTPKGKRLPIDPTPSDEGTVRLDRPDWTAPPVAVVLAGAELLDAREAEPAVPLYVPHWHTCTDPDRFRRRTPTRRDEDAAGVVRLADARARKASPRLPGLDT